MKKIILILIFSANLSVVFAQETTIYKSGLIKVGPIEELNKFNEGTSIEGNLNIFNSLKQIIRDSVKRHLEISKLNQIDSLSDMNQFYKLLFKDLGSSIIDTNSFFDLIKDSLSEGTAYNAYSIKRKDTTKSGLVNYEIVNNLSTSKLFDKAKLDSFISKFKSKKKLEAMEAKIDAEITRLELLKNKYSFSDGTISVIVNSTFSNENVSLDTISNKSPIWNNESIKRLKRDYDALIEEAQLSPNIIEIKTEFRKAPYNSYLWFATLNQFNPFVKQNKPKPKSLQDSLLNSYLNTVSNNKAGYSNYNLGEFEAILDKIKGLNTNMISSASVLNSLQHQNKVLNLISLPDTTNPLFKNKKDNLIILDYNKKDMAFTIKAMKRTVTEEEDKHIFIFNVPRGVNLKTEISEEKLSDKEAINQSESTITGLDAFVSNTNLFNLFKGQPINLKAIAAVAENSLLPKPNNNGSGAENITGYIGKNNKSPKGTPISRNKFTIIIPSEPFDDINENIIFLNYLKGYIKNDITKITQLLETKNSSSNFYTYYYKLEAESETKIRKVEIKKSSDAKLDSLITYKKFSYKIGGLDWISISLGFSATLLEPNRYSVIKGDNDIVKSIEQSNQQVKLRAGIHFYPAKYFKLSESFLGINNKKFKHHFSLYTGFQVTKNPLDNIFTGVSFDLIPGIKLGTGANFILTNNYIIRNNILLDTKKQVSLRPYVSIDISPASTLTSLLALFALSN